MMQLPPATKSLVRMPIKYRQIINRGIMTRRIGTIINQTQFRGTSARCLNPYRTYDQVIYASMHTTVTNRSPSNTSKPGEIYDAVYRRSIDEPDSYWLEQAESIEWTKRGTKALTQTGPQPYEYRWFADGWETNACQNMIDVHVKSGLGQKTAIIYDSPVTNTILHISYDKLLTAVSQLAGALKHAGVTKGDRVLIYMPMIPQTIQGMLATIRLGAIHSVVFGGFPANELAKRIADAQPTVILTASCGLESSTKIIFYKPELDEAIRLSKWTPKKVLVYQRPLVNANLQEGRDVDWKDYVSKFGQETPCVQVKATDPLYILYTSGTTGTPKGVVRDVASIVALKASMQSIYGHKKEDVYWSGSDLGWAVGHSYIVCGPLLQGTTTVLYEGKPVNTPDAGAFWRVCAQHKVSELFTAPTALRAIKKEDPEGKLMKNYDLSNLKALFLAGERADPNSLAWARDHLHIPVLDHWWQTETGWSIVGNPRGIELLPVKDGSATKPSPGWNVMVLDDSGKEVPRGVEGNLVVKLPLPPSGLHTLWNNEERFVKSYMTKFPGYYDTSDAGHQDEDGYVFVMTRTDDVMNVAGHRLSSGQMEEVLQDHPCVAESAVIAIPDTLRGHVPIGIVVLKSGIPASMTPQVIESELVQSVRERVGAIACFKRVLVVPRLPKTRSGKLLRNVLRAMGEGKKDLPIPPTIEDASVLEEVRAVMQGSGIINDPNHPSSSTSSGHPQRYEIVFYESDYRMSHWVKEFKIVDSVDGKPIINLVGTGWHVDTYGWLNGGEIIRLRLDRYPGDRPGLDWIEINCAKRIGHITATGVTVPLDYFFPIALEVEWKRLKEEHPDWKRPNQEHKTYQFHN